ncbi:MAG: tetratricopeptide repeat protein [Proteobacteria bacterium]|nr:tetratricopeptide repeat protein [Pseudomonadota bacterium]
MRSRSHTGVIAALLMGVALGGCSTNLKEYTGSIGNMSLSAPGGTSIEALAARYDARPGEKRASLEYGAALRARGQLPQAVAVLQRASVSNIGDRDVAAAYGKALAEAGRFDEAIAVLGQAHTDDRPNWQVLSTMGSIHDQLGKHEQARELYHRALQIAPKQSSVLNNLGLSYMLTQELAQAEATLAEAAAQPGSDQRVAANLALARSLRAKAAAPATPAAPAKTRKVSAAGAAFDLKGTMR